MHIVSTQLYGLFKYVTVSASPNTSRPSVFDMTGRAKWDAWSAAGKTYHDGADAENRYLAIARSLGWEKETTGARESKSDEIDLDNISDDDNSSGGSDGGGGPMGGTVSSMASLHEEIDLNTIHGLAVSNDGPKLASFLREYPHLDINSLNEHVRIFASLSIRFC
jgi:acyl-CoA-binding protein